MTIKEAHDYIDLRLDKDQVGYFSREEKDKAIDRAQMSHFMRLYSNPKEYQQGRPVRSAAFSSQKIHDDLAPFKKRWYYNEENYSSINPSGTGPDGVLVLPSDNIHPLAIIRRGGDWQTLDTESKTASTGSFTTEPLEAGRTYRIRVYLYTGATANVILRHEGDEIINASLNGTTNIDYFFTANTTGDDWSYSTTAAIDITISEFVATNRYMVEILNEDQIGLRLESNYLAPTTSSPIIRQIEGGGLVNQMDVTNKRMQLFPQSGQFLELQYLRRPRAPEYVYTTNGEVQTHDAAASTDPEWNDEAMGEILEEAIQLLASNANDQLGLSVSAQKKAEGV